MPTIEVVPFAEEQISPAAELVAARYREARAAIPEIPPEFERAEAIGPLIASSLGVPGAAAYRDGEFVGFLLGMLFMHRRDEFAYAADYLHGAVSRVAEPVYRALYGHLARRWLELGCFAQAITLYPTERAALDAWFWLGFGMLGVDAIRDLDFNAPYAEAADIRRARPEDASQLEPLRLGVERHLASPPSFIPLLASSGADAMARWLEDSGNAIWMAVDGGVPVSYLKIGPSSAQVLCTKAKDIAGITGAYTAPAHRGQGLAGALLKRGLEWAKEQGYTRCSVDFESANALGSAFWLGGGFRPVAFSLERRINPRAAWAHERRSDGDLSIAPRAG